LTSVLKEALISAPTGTVAIATSLLRHHGCFLAFIALPINIQLSGSCRSNIIGESDTTVFRFDAHPLGFSAESTMPK